MNISVKKKMSGAQTNTTWTQPKFNLLVEESEVCLKDHKYFFLDKPNIFFFFENSM